MKTILDKTNREEIISRINLLNENSQALWGKMTVYQMLKHCTTAEEMYLGKKSYKRVLLGRIFGKMGLRNILDEKKSFPKNANTLSVFKVSGTGDINQQKREWINLLHEYENFNLASIEHWFFGKMTREQVGQFTYKHADHHLRQFNV